MPLKKVYQTNYRFSQVLGRRSTSIGLISCAHSSKPKPKLRFEMRDISKFSIPYVAVVQILFILTNLHNINWLEYNDTRQKHSLTAHGQEGNVLTNRRLFNRWLLTLVWIFLLNSELGEPQTRRGQTGAAGKQKSATFTHFLTHKSALLSISCYLSDLLHYAKQYRGGTRRTTVL